MPADVPAERRLRPSARQGAERDVPPRDDGLGASGGQPADTPAMASRQPSHFDRRFIVVVASAFCYFAGIGVLVPVLPRYVEDVLDGGGVQVGIAVGAFAISAAAMRPWVGRLGDDRGRRLLVVGGCTVAAASISLYGLPGGLAVLVLLRLVTGAGEAAVFVGAATAAQDLAPPERRGQAASFFSISIYGGLAVGPAFGEWIYKHHGSGPAWATSATACALAALLGLAMGGHERRPEPRPQRLGGLRALLHPAGLRPGVILFLGAAGFAGFASFVPLYVDEVDLDDATPFLVEYAVIVLVIRIFGSRLPDVLGTRRGPLLALALQAIGLVLMGALGSVAGLYVGTGVFALGVSLLYPALFPAVIEGAPPEERSQAVATFSVFFDLSQGLGAPMLGTVVAVGGERWAFVAAGMLSALGFVLHRAAPPPVPVLAAG